MEYKKHKPITRIPLWDIARGKVSSDRSFAPTVESLLSLHREMFQADAIIAPLAWQIRIMHATAWEYAFTKPENIYRALERSFQQKRNTPYEILAWCIDTLWWIHPFYDGNRRCIWEYTNRWLISEWYEPIDWDEIRPIWEADIHEEGTLD